jgi:hypothetical protein
VDRYRAFGLTLRSCFPLPGLRPAREQVGPLVDIELAGERDLERAWSGPSGQSDAVGEVHGGSFRVARGVAGDHRLTYGRFATFHVSADGARILCAPAERDEFWWRRELLDTVLWLCSLAHGYEALHASAVELPQGVAAIVAGSGGGKTTVAAELVRRGHRLFCDDVLTLERADGRLQGHPGPPLMNLPRGWNGGDHSAIGLAVAELGDEVWTSVTRAADERRPLAGVFFLDRTSPDVVEIESAHATIVDLRPHLFAHPFLEGRERERFALSADLLDEVPVARIRVSPAVSAEAIGDLVERAGRSLDRAERVA